jgi:hypothetical protein
MYWKLKMVKQKSLPIADLVKICFTDPFLLYSLFAGRQFGGNTAEQF